MLSTSSRITLFLCWFSVETVLKYRKIKLRGPFMADIKKIVANNICELRQDKELTQLELAQKLNYSDKAVSKWERGESLPDLSVLIEIANLFGVTLDYLLGRCDEI